MCQAEGRAEELAECGQRISRLPEVERKMEKNREETFILSLKGTGNRSGAESTEH